MTASYVLDHPEGTITIPSAVLAQVVVGSAEQVERARVRRPRRGLELEVEGNRARVTVEIAVPHGAVIPDAAAEVQRRVAEGLQRMCGLGVSAVDVRVEELVG